MTLPRGELRVAEPRELLVSRFLGSAFKSDGRCAGDTICARNEGGDRIHPTPRRIKGNVIAANEEEAVWGGVLFPHFGHFLIESVSRLWPVLPGGPLEGAPVVLACPPNNRNPFERPFVCDWIEAFGVNLAELPEQGIVRYARMHVPEPAWRLDTWIAPEIRDIHLHAREGLGELDTGQKSDLVWITRQGLSHLRVAHDEALLEWILSNHITVLAPESKSLAEQVATLESARTVAGVSGSAFHTMLLLRRVPDCAYLFPSWERPPYTAQHRVLRGRASFFPVMSAQWTPAMRRRGVIFFPFGYRISIPDTLRALQATALSTLFDDPTVARFAMAHDRTAVHTGGNALDAAVTAVLRDPLSAERRNRLGELFEAEGLQRCAAEQFRAAALLCGSRRGAARAAALLTEQGRDGDAAHFARIAA